MITIATHSGTFHADDLFALASLKMLLLGRGLEEDKIKIVRTRDEEKIRSADYVADVGGIHNPEKNRFDHHQKGGAGERDNGIPYAAFGLIWKTYGEEITGSEESAGRIDERLVQTIDALDNGIDVVDRSVSGLPHLYLLQSAFGSFHPTWKEKGHSITEAFFKALVFAESILKREIAHEEAQVEAFLKIEERYKNKKSNDERILVLDQDYPYGRFVEENPQIIFVVKPDEENKTWKVRTVQKEPNSFASRKSLPIEWAGKVDGELVQITGVKDALFVHNKLFIAVARTRDGAIELAQKALEA